MKPIARAHRKWKKGHAFVTLYFDPNVLTFHVRYEELTDRYRNQWIPEQCTKAWLWNFIRPQETLQPDSYYVTYFDEPYFYLIANLEAMAC